MRPFRALVFYLLTVLIGGALLAPWLCDSARLLGRSAPQISGAPFPRYVDRALLIFALALLWPFLRALGIKSVRETGMVPPYGQAKRFFGGLLFGFVSLAIVAALTIGSGGRRFVPTTDMHRIVGVVLGAIGSALVVALLEEILFRGGIFGGLRRVLYWPFALAISSSVYALVHFLRRGDYAGPVRWDSGLVALPAMFRGFADFQTLIPDFLSLFLAGILLALAYQRTGNLYFSIGLHAGWIFWLKIYGAFTADAPGVATWFWGGSKMIDGWLAFLVLGVAFFLLKILPLGPKHSPYSIP